MKMDGGDDTLDGRCLELTRLFMIKVIQQVKLHGTYNVHRVGEEVQTRFLLSELPFSTCISHLHLLLRLHLAMYIVS